MRQVLARPDPDSAPRLITLPASWDDKAAAALAALAPGEGSVSLAAAASVWLGLIALRARQEGVPDSLALALHGLLRARRMAPNAAIWACQPDSPGFILNAAAFYEPGSGLDIAGFAAAASSAARACRLINPTAPHYEIGLSGLDDLLACLGLDYDNRAARELAATLAALLRAQVELALEGDQRDLLAVRATWPAPPRRCMLPGLAEAASAAHAQILRAPGSAAATGIFTPGPVDDLLGIETGGIAPAFAHVRDQHLTRAAQNRLAARAMSPEAALAALLEGETPLPLADQAAHTSMHEAVAPYLEQMPPPPAQLPAPPALQAARETLRARHRPLPARHAGLTQKVLLGGHSLFLRTGEYADGRLGEITLTLPRENAHVRGLVESFAQAVSIGLQHGVGLEEFVDAFAHTRFGFAGTVDGDPDVQRATSLLDYVFRTLSITYLGQRLAEPTMEDEPAKPETAPLLPLDLPRGRRRNLRLVA